MPIYEYKCTKCEKEQEFIQKFSDDPVTTCPDCGGEMKKLISTNSFVLKGSGWYMTDYGTKKEKDKAKPKTDPKTDKKEKSTKKDKKTEPVSA
jgi:putative FmdB family regulatory protein